jgi:hypothetical protein
MAGLCQSSANSKEVTAEALGLERVWRSAASGLTSGLYERLCTKGLTMASHYEAWDYLGPGAAAQELKGIL